MLTSLDNQNPYSPPRVDSDNPRANIPRFGWGIGFAGFLLVLAPSLYMCFIGGSMLWSVATMEIPETGIRPMGFPIAMIGLTIVSAFLLPIALLCSWIAARLGSPDGAAIAKASVKIVALPFVLGMLCVLGLSIVCVYRGIMIGD